MISETECELLERRCSQLWRALGFPEYDWWDDRVEYLTSRYFGTCYYYLYAEKYDGYYDEPIGEWEEKMMTLKAEQEAEQLFRDGQGDNLPACSQNFSIIGMMVPTQRTFHGSLTSMASSRDTVDHASLVKTLINPNPRHLYSPYTLIYLS